MPTTRQPGFARLFSFKQIFLCVIFFLLILIGGTLGSRALLDHGRNEIAEKAEQSVRILATDVNRMMEDVDKVSKILSTSPGVMESLTSSEPLALEAANKVLDRYAEGIEDSICYILNLQGDTIASSNRNDANSLVGHNYRFRPYVTEALEGKNGRYFALGVTSKTRGYYSSHAVRSPEIGNVLGVVVVKKEVETLRENFRKAFQSFLVDPNGIVFFASNPSFAFHAIRPDRKSVV